MNEAIKILEDNLNDESVVVATSGGPDSMALLYLVNSLKEKLNLKIVCAHVNHKLRKESDDEEIMVKEFCDKNGIIFEILTINNYNDDNFHNDARTKRYEFFEKCVKKCQAKHLLTAHHGDDLMETILMRLVRGSSLKGYAGFSLKTAKEDYEILRPLIKYTKDEVLDFVCKNKIPYAVDNSNEKDVYTRNRFRKYILPVLKNEDANVHQKFYKFSKTLEMYDEYISNETKKHIDKVVNNNSIIIDEYKKLNGLIQIKVIEKILLDIYGEEVMLITDVHTKMIHNLIYGNKPNQTVNLPNKITAVKKYNILSVEKDKNEDSYKFEFDEFITLPNGKTITKSETQGNSNNVCRLNSKEIKLPLYIRNRKEGDKIEVKGLNGTKKVKDIFIDKKIPMEERKTHPIVVDSNGKIVWIPGIKKSKFDKPKKENYDIILEYV